MDQPRLLDIKDLHVHFKVYGGTLKVLDGVSFAVGRGEKVGLVGETGCGKTTTMKATLRVLPMPPALIPKGEILFEGKDVLKMRDDGLRKVRGRGISMIFQDPTAALNPVFNIGQQIGAVVRHSTDERLSRREVHDRVIEPLREVSLPDAERMLGSYPIQLSGGMRQRCCLAMALSCGAPLLIADEPSTALDVTIQAQVLMLLLELREHLGVGMILVTHNLGVAAQTCDRVAVMYAGVVVESGETADVFKRPVHPYTKALYSCLPQGKKVDDLATIPGSVPDLLDPPTGCRYHPRCPHAFEKCVVVKPEVTDVGAGHEAACHLLSSGGVAP